MEDNKEYYLGLDLGTTSIGWAVFSRSRDKQGKTTASLLEDLGVRIFPEPIFPDNGKTFAEFRRKCRGTKRILRRKKHRVARLINLLDKIQFINKHHLQDFLIILRLSERELQKYHNCCPQWIINNNKKEKDRNESCFPKKYSVCDPRHKIKNKNKNFIDFYTLAKNAERSKIDRCFLSYVLIYLARHRGYIQSFETDESNWLEKKAGERKNFSSFTELYDLIKKLPYAIRNSSHWKKTKFTKESDFIKHIYFNRESNKETFQTIPYESIKKFIIVNSLLKKTTIREQQIINLPSEIDNQKKIGNVVKEIADFNDSKNKELWNFILDFYEFAQGNVIFNSEKTINIKIENNEWKCSTHLKKQKPKPSFFYIKKTEKKFEIILGENFKKEKEHWEYSQQMLINRVDLQKSVEKIFKEQKKYYPELKEAQKEIMDIIFEQRTFEEGPGHTPGEKKIYSGYNIKTLLKNGKRSEDGSLVGFRSSLIGDLYNVCCEVSKLDLKKNNSMDKISKKQFYQSFLKEYLNPESVYYKNNKPKEKNEPSKKQLMNFKIYSFNFKKFASDNNKIIDTSAQIQSENSKKTKKLVDHVNGNIKITFLNLIFNINKHKKDNQNNQEIWEKVSNKQNFSKTKDTYFYISVIFHEFHTPKKIFNILNGDVEKDSREEKLYKKIKGSLENNILKNILFKNKKGSLDELVCWKNILLLKKILKGGMCNKSFKEMQNDINEFIQGKNIYENYYNNEKVFSQFNKKTPLLITNKNQHEIKEQLIIQDKYRKLNSTFFKDEEKNGKKININILKEKQEIQIEIIKKHEYDESYTFKFKEINSEYNIPDKIKLPVMNDPSIKANRAVYRALTQTRKVLNALLAKYKFKNINIELARDFYLSNEKKKELERKQKANKKQNQEAIEKGFRPRKWRIREEHHGKCYLCNEETNIDEGELDHIIAQSIISNDSYDNLAWICNSCNRKKGKEFPKQYIKKQGGEVLKKWEERMKKLFASKTTKLSYIMAENEEDPCIKDYNPTRRLNDTRYIARFFYNYLHKHIGLKTKFQTKFNCITGYITSLYRKKWLWWCKDEYKSAWGYEDKQEIKKITDFNHAVDAVILCNLGTPQRYKLIAAANRYEKWEYDTKMKRKGKDPSEKEKNIMLKVIEKDYSLTNIDLVKIKRWKNAKPFFMSSKELREQLKKRIPVKIKIVKSSVNFSKGENNIKKKYEIEFDKIIQEENYPKEWQYPYISRMVIRKVKRGTLGSQEPLTREKKREKITNRNPNIAHDKHGNVWEMHKKWAFYFDKNKKKVFFLNNYQIQERNNYKKIKSDNWNLIINNLSIKIKKKNILFVNELLELKFDDNLSNHYVFVTGSTNNDVYLNLNQLTKKKQTEKSIAICRKEYKLVKKKDNQFNFKKLSENSKKIVINILGHKK